MVFPVVQQYERTGQLHVPVHVLGMCGRGGVYSERRYLIHRIQWYHTAVFDIP